MFKIYPRSLRGLITRIRFVKLYKINLEECRVIKVDN